DDAQAAKRFKTEWLKRGTDQTSADIMSQHGCLFYRGLSCRRTCFTGLGVWHRGAVAKRPNIPVAWYHQRPVNQHRASVVVINRQLFKDRTRSSTCGPNERLCRDLFS